MKNKKKKPSALKPIIIAVVCLFAVFFAFLYIFTYGDIASVFTQRGEKQQEQTSAQVTVTPTPTPLATPIPSPTPSPLPKPPEFLSYRPQLTGSDYITIEVDKADIHSGYLILINPDIYYDIPDDLGLISIASVRSSSYRAATTSQRLKAEIMPFLNDMIDAFAEETGKTYIRINSAYRTFNEQRNVYNQYASEPGRAARPGHSEHHTGLALDFDVYIDGVRYPFDNFDVAKNWFSNNSHIYGFIRRYPANKTNITKVISEPWHYRYVGLPHSTIMKENDWVLEEYLEKLRNYTVDEPYTAQVGGETYEVFFTDNTTITVPARAKYDISGNNIDGYIVTISQRYDRLTNVSRE